MFVTMDIIVCYIFGKVINDRLRAIQFHKKYLLEK